MNATGMNPSESLDEHILELVAAGSVPPDVADELLSRCAPSARTASDIVATGAAVRLPDASTLEEMWELLHRAQPIVRQFPRRRLELVLNATDALSREYGHLRESLADDARSYGSWLTGVEEFAPERYGMDDFEAMFLGPFERILLDLASEALEASCIDIPSLAGSRTGVFLAHNPDTSLPYTRLFDDPDERAVLSGIPANVAYRVAYTLGLHGPVMNIDTTCSSSLSAIHIARRSLQAGDCDTAIVGGISLDLLPFRFSDATSFVLSPRHICNAYDAHADGTAWGEGAAVVVLRRSTDASRDGNPTLVQIPGSAMTSDGRSNGMMSPNPVAHTRAVREALGEAHIGGRDIGYIEGHGAGTVLGDQIEVAALADALGEDTTDTGYCDLGSAKPVVGHLKDAAGIIGFLSAALRVRHGILPALASLQQPNDAIEWSTSPFTLSTESRPWPKDRARTAGVSSLGLSGTNTHVLVSESAQPRPPASPQTLPVLVSAESRWSLWEMLNRLVVGIPHDADVNAVAATLARRPLKTARVAVQADSVSELITKIERITEVRAFDKIPETFGRQGILIADNDYTRPASLAALSDDTPHRALLARYLNGDDTQAEYRELTADIRPMPLPVPPPATRRIWPAAATGAEDVRELLFDMQWTAAPRAEEHAPIARLLLIGADSATADAFRTEADRRGIEVVAVAEDPQHRLDQESTYTELFSRSRRPFDSVVLATGLDREAPATMDEIAESQRTGVHALYALARSLVNVTSEEAFTVAVVGREINKITGSERHHAPARATAFGLLRVMSQEMPHVTELCIDMAAEDDDATVAARVLDDLAVKADSRPHQVAYRDGQRLRRVIERREPVPESDTAGLEVPPGSAHVIAGGTGNLGPELAKFLAGRGAGTVVLLSRRGLPPKSERENLRNDPEWGPRLAALDEVERLGCRIVDITCDLTDDESVDRAFAQIDARGLHIHGGYMLSKQLFHHWIRDLEKTDFRTGIDNRVRGTFLFAEALRKRATQHLLLFSSISSLSGTKGAAECAAVNQYLDAAGPWYTALGLPTYTVNWALILADRSSYKSRTPIPPIDLTEFHAALAHVFDAPRALEVIARLDLAEASYLRPVLRIPLGDRLWEEAERDSSSRKTLTETEAVEDVAVDARTAVATAWETALGSGPDVNPHFFDAGGTSLSVIRFVHQVAKHVGSKDKLDVADVYAAPTFEALVAKVGSDAQAQESGVPAAPSVDDILARVEAGELTPEAAADLIAKET